VKFKGKVHYSGGDWLGVALDESTGKNDGTIKVMMMMMMMMMMDGGGSSRTSSSLSMRRVVVV